MVSLTILPCPSLPSKNNVFHPVSIPKTMTSRGNLAAYPQVDIPSPSHSISSSSTANFLFGTYDPGYISRHT